MGYDGPADDANVFPWKDKDAQYEYGLKKADEIWESKKEQYPDDFLNKVLHHLLWCDYWDDYRSQAYLDGITKGIENKIREYLK